MNIKEAHSVPLDLILQKIAATLHKADSKDAWYFSPFRDEKTASFHVNLRKNIWYDFGERLGGNSLSLAIKYLKETNQNSEVSEALRWLKTIDNFTPISFERSMNNKINESNLSVENVTPIKAVALKHYLKKRGIPLNTAEKYLRQVSARDNKNGANIYALGFKNQDNGWELRNPIFKGCIAPKAISFIRGSIVKPKTIHVFEGFMDFLTLLAHHKREILEGDSIVLNSTSCVEGVFPFLYQYGYTKLYTWLDNDTAGNKATQTLAENAKTHEALVHHNMQNQFAPHKDLNAWHMHKLGLN